MKIEEALQEIKILKKQLAQANFLIAKQKKTIKELNSKLEEKKHSASQDQTTQNQADKSQKLAYQTINIKPAIPKQTN